MILSLHKSLVRPHLEYAVQFRYPHLRQNINKIDNGSAMSNKDNSINQRPQLQPKTQEPDKEDFEEN